MEEESVVIFKIVDLGPENETPNITKLLIIKYL